MIIELPERSIDDFDILINYEVGKESSAIQWLEPSQTSGKKFPYLFTQCQAIHARSLVPCQDTSFVKFTYSATVKVDPIYKALMSAIGVRSEHYFCNADSSVCKIAYHFFQQVPIPSYLLALVVGNLKGQSISQRVGIWSEPELVSFILF